MISKSSPAITRRDSLYEKKVEALYNVNKSWNMNFRNIFSFDFSLRNAILTV